MAWWIPPIWDDLQKNLLTVPKNSRVVRKQENLMRATRAALEAVAEDIRGGLLETVGVNSHFSIDDGCCSMVLKLPENTDTEKIARAIDMENIEAWCGAEGEVHLAVSPWYSTKDVDQTVLSAVKVIHVLLGIHAGDTVQPKTFGQKLLSSVAEVMSLLNDNGKKEK
jgi:hypothetical protein